MVRGIDSAWIHNVYSFALKPDAVFYLRIGVDDLVPRVVFSRGFDYWESGMDLHTSEDMFESFRKYQSSLLQQFDVLAQEYNFEVIDASASARTVFELLRSGIARVLSGEPREPLFAVQSSDASADEIQARKGVDTPVENELEQDVLK